MFVEREYLKKKRSEAVKIKEAFFSRVTKGEEKGCRPFQIYITLCSFAEERKSDVERKN